MFGGRGRGGPIPGADQEAELELTLEEAYRGGRKHLTFAGGEGGYDVTIPPGVVDGQRIRLAGQVEGAPATPRPGIFTWSFGSNRIRATSFRAETSTSSSPCLHGAALGATIPVQTLGGEVKVRVAPGSSSGRRLRLRGEGMPNPKGKPGDLYAEVRVMVPKTLSRRERELFEELAAVSDFDPRRGS